MNKEEFIIEVEQIGEGCTIVTNESEYTIEDGSYFIGGEEGTFMSELLGNVYYDDIEDIASVMYDYITNELHETIEDVYYS